MRGCKKYPGPNCKSRFEDNIDSYIWTVVIFVYTSRWLLECLLTFERDRRCNVHSSTKLVVLIDEKQLNNVFTANQTFPQEIILRHEIPQITET